MLVRFGKFILFFFITCLVLLIVYWGVLNIFDNKNSYDGTFVLEEKETTGYGNLY